MSELAHPVPAIAPVDDEPEGRPAAFFYRRPSAAELAAVVVALVAAAGAAAIVLAGGVVSHPDAYAAVLACDIVGLTAAGLVWLRARPASPLGGLLLALAGVSVLVSLSGAGSPFLYLVGILMQWVFAVGVVWAIAAFPGGRLDRAGRPLVWFALGIFVCCQLPLLLVASSTHGASSLGRCTQACPKNLLVVAPDAGAAHALAVAGGIGRLAWATGIVAFILLRFAGASRPRRRIVLPVYLVSLLYAAGFGLNALIVDVLGDRVIAPPSVRLMLVAARILFPLGFVAAILLAHAYAGTALTAMAADLGRSPTVAGVEQLVRRVLDDPRAKLAFWVPRFGGFADRQGLPVRLDPAEEWHSWRLFRRGGDKVLALEHDPALSDDPELVQAVGQATLIALENRRLQRSLLDSIAELRASQRRLVLAAASERRRIERDLHDSTQQKLVALRIQLELAHEQAPAAGPLRSRLAQLGADLDEAIDELRAVAHGIYPQLLVDEGLPAALRDAARRVGIPIRLQLEDVGRWPEELETAVYYCCLEALQNVAKHGGDGVCAVVRLWREGRSLRFSVVDDGVGFSIRDRPGGDGLTNMADRIGAIGGAVAVRSAPGQGTSVEGRVDADAVERRGDGSR